MFWVYQIQNPEGKTYIGSTENLDERVEMHNNVSFEKKRFHRTTYKRGPWRLIFCKEFQTRKEALEFERFLKTGKGRAWLERARLGG
ncbi:MAG: GIY-YIG nuclease family protein [Patescibacteria group bacterium]